MINRLWVKLTLAFLLIALIAVGVVGVLSARSTGAEFRQYVVSANMMAQPVLAESLAEYYSTYGSWDGVGTLLAGEARGQGVQGAAGRGAGMMGRGRGQGGPNLVVTDADGVVVADSGGQMQAQRLPASTLAQGIPLVVQDRQVGTLLALAPSDTLLDTAAQAFLDRVRSSLVLAGLVATGLALVLGVLVSWQLTAPLRRLTDAATAIAGGNLSQRVNVRGSDEMGELGVAFDHMATNLEQAETLRRSLMADVAHELRTPLTIIQGNLQAILDGVYPLDQAQVASLYDESRLLTRLVDDLRDLALAEAGQLRLEQAPLDLADLAKSAVSNFGAAAENAGITLTLDAPHPVAIEGDADRLGQVLRNLLGNALRHTPTGGRVSVGVRARDTRAIVEVTDTGTGIDSADLPHVFDRFYRADKSRSRRGGGTGLGLAITRQLIAAHNGEIGVRSEPGQGATFTISLPLAGRR